MVRHGREWLADRGRAARSAPGRSDRPGRGDGLPLCRCLVLSASRRHWLGRRTCRKLKRYLSVRRLCWERAESGGGRPVRPYLCRSRKPPADPTVRTVAGCARSEEHTSELQSLMRITYAVFCFI